MAVSTIEGHLALCVGTGDIEIQKVISSEKIDLMSEYFLANPLSGIGQAKEALGDSITYSEIHYFQKHLAYLKQRATE